MYNLTIEIEAEDQGPDAQLLYQTLPEKLVRSYLQTAVNQLTASITSNYPAFAQEILRTFSDFYLFIIFVESTKSQALNHQYRQKNYPTNVLSFPSAIPMDFYKTLPKSEQQFELGDLVIDLSVIKKEAEQQNKKLENHLTHILIHGMLHLFSFDHVLPNDAVIMEQLEIDLLSYLNFPNPYESI